MDEPNEMRNTRLIYYFLVAMHTCPIPPALSGTTGTGALVVDGKAIDPVCLLGLARASNTDSVTIKLRKCGNEDIVVGSGPSDPAMFGLNYHVRDAHRASQGRYLFYRLLGFYRGRALLFIEFNHGGASNWTKIVGVKIDGDTLESETAIATGDRCNGGLFNVSVDHGHLFYDQRLSPYNLVNVAHDLPPLEAGPEAESLASACFAVLHVADGRWTSVWFTRTAMDRKNDWPEDYGYSSCFGRMYHGYVTRKDTELDHAGVRRFVNTFVSTCLNAR